MVENLVITENDTMIETAGLYTWSEMVSPEESSGEAVMTSIADNKLDMKNDCRIMPKPIFHTVWEKAKTQLWAKIRNWCLMK